MLRQVQEYSHRLMQKFCILTAVLWSTQNDGVASFGALSLLVEWQKGHLDSAIIPQKSLPKVVKKENQVVNGEQHAVRLKLILKQQ